MNRRVVVAVAAAALMLVGLLAAARLGHDRSGSDGRPTSGRAPGAGSGSPTAGGSPDEPALRGLVGAGCSDYQRAVPTGPGSVPEMARETFASALRGNPLLTTFGQGLSGRLNPKVDLMDLIAGGRFTVFAPIDSAYAALPAVTLQRTTSNPTKLRKALSSLLVRGQLPPSQVAGRHVTLSGSTVTVTRTGAGLEVGGATVVCGGLQTTNVMLYLLDAVPAAG
jgi:uncharacterized surface protein with fasciclin (FAS1) repeats